ncbi:hypothetical protein BRM22_24210 [Xanthomonas oryzae pv. oryzae]|uniref:Uncharacterized protein n=2 Tax=Xanthomonas oryzae pv. oryzae TaxID=64187 RepID=A0AAJ5M8V6_XANOO|nr:hypothetical protein CDO19_00650 [Xanthomonas oryzae pv. oryzae]AXI19986.1 hypothetical protein CDO11_00645 [Xanthomonas oryzae pv. oryzae]AXM08235.1 hypothetical protein BRM60_00650 [Xanthomonas oryzae pv. oryzae]AXM12041.1 hypothetical protein BRN32_00640 [Xanthomonas oryzae pv. oryzae]AXM15752.1 hypothetical protein BRN66_00660 [Xanthomonas oryzae pv. oryzae]
MEIVMKTPYQVQQELERLERLVPHIVSDQGDRAEEILGFHIASLLGSAPANEHMLIRARTARMACTCRSAQDAVRARKAPVRPLGIAPVA